MAAETPLVHRSVRTGGLLLVVASLQFVIALFLTESRLSRASLLSARVTNLGTAPSPWGLVFNVSLVVLGVVAAVALLLSWSAFDTRPTRGIGLFLLLAGAAAAIGVGALSLGGVSSSASSIVWARGAGVTAVGLGYLVVAFAMHRQERWRASRAYTLASGVAVLACGALYATGTYLGLGPGGIERLGLGVALLWPMVEGAHIALLHRFAPGLHVKVAAA